MFDIEQIKLHLSEHGYEYIKEIGSGAYSKVFLCKSLKYNSEFAIKCISDYKVKEYEYKALINLNHHHIIQLYEVFEGGNYQFLIMEYCPNETLKKKGKLDYARFIYYSKQILEALAYCHSKRIAHRDIKPDNIFLDKYDRVKLADFGFAKQFDKNTISNERCGSTMYCSPEIIKDQSLFNPFQADIYALGITFFYMITGEHPFPNFSVENLKKMIVFGSTDFSSYEIDYEIQNMIIKMTLHNPKLRPTAQDLLDFPIYKQYESNSIYFYRSKSKDLYLNQGTTNKKIMIKPATSFMVESKCDELLRKSILFRKKGHPLKYEILRPNVIRMSSQF